MTGSPTPLRMLLGALATLGVAVAVWAFVEWRSAPPPPPDVTMPGNPRNVSSDR